jgi:hypothetical protein
MAAAAATAERGEKHIGDGDSGALCDGDVIAVSQSTPPLPPILPPLLPPLMTPSPPMTALLRLIGGGNATPTSKLNAGKGHPPTRPGVTMTAAAAAAAGAAPLSSTFGGVLAGFFDECELYKNAPGDDNSDERVDRVRRMPPRLPLRLCVPAKSLP